MRWRELSQGWKIAIVSISAAFIITALSLIVTLSWPHIYDKFWGKHPDVFVVAYGLEHSYTYEQLKLSNSNGVVINFIPILHPPESTLPPNNWVPVKLLDWQFSDGQKLYTLVVHNKGDGIAKKVKIDIDFTPNLIVYSKPDNPNRIIILNGGNPTSSRAVFELDELLPDETQSIEILVNGNTITSLHAWTENQEDIKSLYVTDMIFDLKACA